MTYYLTLFDGKKKTFEEVEHVFDALYHEDCIITYSDGSTRTREEMKQNHAKKLAMASKCTLLLFQVKTFDTFEIKYRLVNDEEDKVVHQVLTTNGDNKVTKGKVTVAEATKEEVAVSEKFLKSNKRESSGGEGGNKMMKGRTITNAEK